MTDIDDTSRRQAALDLLTRTRDRQQALAPLKNLISDAGQQTRAAVQAADAAGLSQRQIAALLGITQPAVNEQLDGRAAAPLPEPSPAAQAWALHYVVSATASELARLAGAYLPGSPSGWHVSPTDLVPQAAAELQRLAALLSRVAAAMDYASGGAGAATS